LKPASKQAAALYQKLPQAYLGLGKYSEARETIDKAIELVAKVQAETAKAAKADKPAGPSLPAKLIITVSKKLLDQAGSGKITMEDFAKGATVEYLTFPAGKE
jgi:hypothetical protein